MTPSWVPSSSITRTWLIRIHLVDTQLSAYRRPLLLSCDPCARRRRAQARTPAGAVRRRRIPHAPASDDARGPPPRPGGPPARSHPTPCSWLPSRRRTAAVRDSTSRSPRMTITGTFCSWASPDSCSASGSRSCRPRRAVRGRAAAPTARWPDHGCRSAIGMTSTWNGRAPEREGAPEVLGQDANEPFQRSIDGAVDRHRAFLAAVRVDVPKGRNRSGSITRSAWMVAVCHSRPSASSIWMSILGA